MATWDPQAPRIRPELPGTGQPLNRPWAPLPGADAAAPLETPLDLGKPQTWPPPPSGRSDYRPAAPGAETSSRVLAPVAELANVPETSGHAPVDWQHLTVPMTAQARSVDPVLRARQLSEAAAAGATPDQLANIGKITGWKLHLPVVADEGNALTAQVVAFLRQQHPGQVFKVGHGDGNGMTVYVGARHDADGLARELDARFGPRISALRLHRAEGDHPFQGAITGRFDDQDFREPSVDVFGRPALALKYSHYDDLLAADQARLAFGPSDPVARTAAKARADAARRADFGAFYSG